MNKRNFLKKSVLFSILGFGGVVTSSNILANDKALKTDDINNLRTLNNHDQLKLLSQWSKEAKTIDFKGIEFFISISNIHTDFYKESMPIFTQINSENLYPFSYKQGDFAIQLKLLSKGFIEMHVYQLDKKNDKYVKVAENKTNYLLNKSNTAVFPGLGLSFTIESEA